MMLGAEGPTLLAPSRVDDGSVPWTIRNTFIDILDDNPDQADGFFNTAPGSCWPYSSLQADLRGTNFGSYLPSAAGTSKKERQSSSEEEDGELPEDGEILSNEPEEGELNEDEEESEDIDDSEDQDSEHQQPPPEVTRSNLPPSGPAPTRRRRASAVCPPPPPGEPVPSKGSARHYNGTCRPCAWLHRSDGSGCRNAEACLYCHLCPDGELKRRKKTKMQRRMDEVRQLRHRMRMLDGEPATPSIAVVGPSPGRTTPAMVDGRAAVGGAGGAVLLEHVSAMEPCYIEVRPERPAAGSLGHNLGRCRPCAWFHKDASGCRNGTSCRYCHLCPPGELKRRKRDKWDTQRPFMETFSQEAKTAAVAAEPVRIAAGGQ